MTAHAFSTPNFSLPDWGQPASEKQSLDLVDRPKRKASIVTTEKWSESFSIEPERRESMVHEAKERMLVAAEAHRRKSIIAEAEREERLAVEAQQRESVPPESTGKGHTRKKSVAFVSPTASVTNTNLLDLDPQTKPSEGHEVMKCEKCGHEQIRSKNFPEDSLNRIKEAIAELEKFRSLSVSSELKKKKKTFSPLPFLPRPYKNGNPPPPPPQPKTTKLTSFPPPLATSSTSSNPYHTHHPPTLHGHTRRPSHISSYPSQPLHSPFSSEFSSASSASSRRESTSTSIHGGHSRRPSRADVLFESGRLPGLGVTQEDSGDDANGAGAGGRRRKEDAAGNRIHHKGAWSRMLHWELDASNADTGGAGRSVRKSSRGGKYESVA